jgi:DivIVA domain-containing protein
MDGSQLLLKTDFPEARKGYDKAQVDDFLRALSEKVGELKNLARQATQRAEVAEARVHAEADERVVAEQARAEAEAALRASEAMRAELALTLDETRKQLDVDQVEVATGVLAMAQRTAEATVDEATQQARRLLEDAEVNAAVTQLEAEQRAERTRRDMEEEIEAQRRQQLDVLEAEVSALSARRDALEADVIGLQDFLEAERQKLREAVVTLVRTIDHEGPLVLGRPPERTAPPAAAEEESAPELPFREPATDAERRATQIPHLLEAPAADAAATPAGEDEPPADAADEAVGEAAAAPDEPGEPDESAGATVIDLTAAPSASGAGTDDEPAPTGADAGDGEEASPLGEPRAEADTAMREFFEPGGPSDARRALRRRR